MCACAGEWLRKGTTASTKAVPDGFDDATEWQAFMHDFRSQLGRIMKHISKLMPEAALGAAAQRLQAALAGAGSSPANSTPSEVGTWLLMLNAGLLSPVLIHG